VVSAAVLTTPFRMTRSSQGRGSTNGTPGRLQRHRPLYEKLRNSELRSLAADRANVFNDQYNRLVGVVVFDA
jgi:hypothetical protein